MEGRRRQGPARGAGGFGRASKSLAWVARGMPPKSAALCSACKRLPPAAGRAGRCQYCYRKKRRWRTCAGCGQEAACRAEESAEEWRCGRCEATMALESGLACRSWGRHTADEDALGLYDAHLEEWLLVEVWLVPTGKKPCLLAWARLLLWRRWGVLAGLVRGAAKALTWSHGVRQRDPAALALHFRQLRDAGHWPRGTAPVLLTGWRPGDVAAVRERLGEVGFAQHEVDRLRGLPFSLSEHGAIGGLRLAGFVSAPSRPCWTSCDLFKRCRSARVAASSPGAGTCQLISANSAAGGAFRRMLLPA